MLLRTSKSVDQQGGSESTVPQKVETHEREACLPEKQHEYYFGGKAKTEGPNPNNETIKTTEV